MKTSINSTWHNELTVLYCSAVITLLLIVSISDEPQWIGWGVGTVIVYAFSLIPRQQTPSLLGNVLINTCHLVPLIAGGLFYVREQNSLFDAIFYGAAMWMMIVTSAYVTPHLRAKTQGEKK